MASAYVCSHTLRRASRTPYGVAYTDGVLAPQELFKAHVTFHTETADSGGLPVAAISNDTRAYVDPTTYQQAMSYPDADEWLAAVDAETESYIKNGVIAPCDKGGIPAGANIVDTRWVFKRKRLADGTLDKYKARLVARGFTQVYGVDFDETYAPVSQLTTFRIFLALVMLLMLTAVHLDVQTAFLNATLEFEVYIKLPKGFHIGGFQYGRAVKSIYGLKQAARDWHRLQEKFILQFYRRLSRSPIDPCMFFISTEGLLALVVTYVDDYFIASSDPKLTEKFINAFKKRFTVTVLGEPSTVLQMGVTLSRNSVSISQKRFILDLADAHGLRDCAPMQTQMEKDIELLPAKECDLNVPFRSLIGALLWVARCTRPDIMFAVIYLSRFSASFDVQHFRHAKRILRYLVTTVDRELTYHRNGDDIPKALELKCYSDSDWASDKHDRKSFSGNVVFLHGCLVSWFCKKQATVALSSVEAEYMALSDATREVIYVNNLLKNVVAFKRPTAIYIDNKGAGYIAEKELNNKLTKHIDIRYHFVRQYISEKKIELFYVPSAQNIADLFTKALCADLHRKVCDTLYSFV